LSVVRGSIAPMTEQLSNLEMTSLTNSEQTLQRAVLQDGKSDLLSAFERLNALGQNIEDGNAGNHVHLQTLQSVQANIAIALYAALKADLSYLSDEVRQEASRILEVGLTQWAAGRLDEPDF
jgi:hypothetical protein